MYLGDPFVNAEMIRRGYATAMTYRPDVAHSDLFVELEREARSAARVLALAAPFVVRMYSIVSRLT